MSNIYENACDLTTSTQENFLQTIPLGQLPPTGTCLGGHGIVQGRELFCGKWCGGKFSEGNFLGTKISEKSLTGYCILIGFKLNCGQFKSVLSELIRGYWGIKF